MKMKKSKYLGKQFANWTCIYVGLAHVQGKRTKSFGKRNYYYIFQRLTSDFIASKMIRLSSSEAAKVYQGKITVEEIAQKRELKKQTKFTKIIQYHNV